VLAAKLGSRGCMVAFDDQRLSVPAFVVAAVDTNGCGDAFVAGFLHAYTRNHAGAYAAATLGNAMGALTAMRSGAAEALPSRAELRAFLAEHGALALEAQL
jgi:ribokinase